MEDETLHAILRALSDPTRLSIFDLLMDGTHCNCEISEQLGLSLSLISHHLGVLRDVGLVSGERDVEDARWIHYSVDSEAVRQLRAALDRLLNVDRVRPRQPVCTYARRLGSPKSPKV
jgi:ArsR family transcriptional regulator